MWLSKYRCLDYCSQNPESVFWGWRPASIFWKYLTGDSDELSFWKALPSIMIYTPSQMHQWFLSLYSDHGFSSKNHLYIDNRVISNSVYSVKHMIQPYLFHSQSLSLLLLPPPGTRENLVHPQLFCFLILILSISLHSIPVVINFMCWLGWDIVPRYVVKCYFGCFWDSVFWKTLTFKFVPFESSRLSSITWVGFI